MMTAMRYLWCLPNTLAGALLGVLTLLTGGRAQRHGLVLEFHGGASKWLLSSFPNGHILAMTLGYTIVGRDPIALDISRDHELVHVAQYGRWGPLFLPAYVASSLWMWCRGRDPYRDNLFEQEAYAKAPIRRPAGS